MPTAFIGSSKISAISGVILNFSNPSVDIFVLLIIIPLSLWYLYYHTRQKYATFLFIIFKYDSNEHFLKILNNPKKIAYHSSNCNSGALNPSNMFTFKSVSSVDKISVESISEGGGVVVVIIYWKGGFSKVFDNSTINDIKLP